MHPAGENNSFSSLFVIRSEASTAGNTKKTKKQTQKSRGYAPDGEQGQGRPYIRTLILLLARTAAAEEAAEAEVPRRGPGLQAVAEAVGKRRPLSS